MARSRERVQLEDGLRLDLTLLAGRRLANAGPVVLGAMRFRRRHWERRPSLCLDDGNDKSAAGFFVLVLDGDTGRGTLTLSLLRAARWPRI